MSLKRTHGRDRRYLYIAIVCTVLGLLCLSLIGCASPTAPSTSYRLTFAAAPGCSPGEIPKQPADLPTVTIQLPGSRTLTAAWPGLTIEFMGFGSNYLVCKVTRA